MGCKTFDEAECYLEAALDIDERILEESASPEDKRDLSISYNRLAMMYKDMNEYEKAKGEGLFIQGLSDSKGISGDNRDCSGKAGL